MIIRSPKIGDRFVEIEIEVGFSSATIYDAKKFKITKDAMGNRFSSDSYMYVDKDQSGIGKFTIKSWSPYYSCRKSAYCFEEDLDELKKIAVFRS